MNIVVYHNDSFENMTQKIEEMFSGITNKSMHPISYKKEKFPFSKENLGKMVTKVPVKNNDTLLIYFVLPELEAE